jgi:hypothetical protein
MRYEVKRKLDQGARVLTFSLANPSDDPSHAVNLADLQERMKRGEELLARQQSGRTAELAAAERKAELRDVIHFTLLRHVVRVGQAAAEQRPGLIGKFRLRSRYANDRSFLVGAKLAYTEARANQELFVELGCSEAMLDELGKAIAEFEGLLASAIAGRISHVGARADLDAVADEITEVIGKLDPFNRYRFEKDPDRLAEWQSVVGLPKRRTRPASPRPALGGDAPSEGVAPAA